MRKTRLRAAVVCTAAVGAVAAYAIPALATEDSPYKITGYGSFWQSSEFATAAFGQNSIGLTGNSTSKTVMVVGDSLSTGAGRDARDFSNAAPYVSKFTAANLNVRTRAITGGQIWMHRLLGHWTPGPCAQGSTDPHCNPDPQSGWQIPSANIPSFSLAATTPGVKAVFIELGTNDVGCLHPYESKCSWSVPSDAPAGYPTSPPPSTSSAYTGWSNDQKNRITQEATDAIRTLIDNGKCVVWAGPRSFDNINPSTGQLYADGRNNAIWKDDVLWFDTWLKGQVTNTANNGKFFYADWDYETKHNTALISNFSSGDQVHLNTAAAQAALASFAVSKTQAALADSHCA